MPFDESGPRARYLHRLAADDGGDPSLCPTGQGGLSPDPFAAVVGDLAESIAGMKVIQAFAQEDASQTRFMGSIAPTGMRMWRRCRSPFYFYPP